jgi:hypothetical protein
MRAKAHAQHALIRSTVCTHTHAPEEAAYARQWHQATHDTDDDCQQLSKPIHNRRQLWKVRLHFKPTMNRHSSNNGPQCWTVRPRQGRATRATPPAPWLSEQRAWSGTWPAGSASDSLFLTTGTARKATLSNKQLRSGSHHTNHISIWSQIPLVAQGTHGSNARSDPTRAVWLTQIVKEVGAGAASSQLQRHHEVRGVTSGR